MITEDQLEQLAIQWFQDTGWKYVHGAVIAPEGVAAEREDRWNIEHRTPNIERRSEEKRRLAAEREALRTLTPALSQGEKEEDGRFEEAVGTRRGGLPPAMSAALPFRSAQTKRGLWGSGLPQFMGFPWASAIGYRRSLGMEPRGGRRRWNPTIKSDLMVGFMSDGGATCKGCLQVRLERKPNP